MIRECGTWLRLSLAGDCTTHLFNQLRFCFPTVLMALTVPCFVSSLQEWFHGCSLTVTKARSTLWWRSPGTRVQSTFSYSCTRPSLLPSSPLAQSPGRDMVVLLRGVASQVRPQTFSANGWLGRMHLVSLPGPTEVTTCPTPCLMSRWRTTCQELSPPSLTPSRPLHPEL